MTEFDQWRNARQEADRLLQLTTLAQHAHSAHAAGNPPATLAEQLAESRRKVESAYAAALRLLRRPRP